MRRRRSTNAYAVTLFPFLAVLICTMGVLVALLVVAVQAADQSAKKESSEARAAKKDEIKEVQYRIDEAEVRAEGLTDFRPDFVRRLKEARDSRAHLQKSLKDIENEATQLANQLLLLNERPNVAPDALSQLESEEVALKQRILAGREQLEMLEQQKPLEQVVYSIVPTDASGTTNRRPIYIECVGNRLIIQPHGIEFQASDFVPPIQVGNPLDAAMIAIRNYWDEHQLAGTEGDAYPLLIVRPSGAKSYALARYAIQSWDDEFGYELITENLELDFGARDTQLEREIQLAITDAKKRDRRRAIVMANQNRFAVDEDGQGGLQSQYAGLTVDRTNGGFTSAGNERGGDSREYRSGERSENQFGKESDDRRQPVKGDSQAPAESKQTFSGSMGAQGGAAVGNSLEAVANSKGQDWALPSRTKGGTVYRRPITIICSADQLIVQSGASLDDQPQRLPMNGATSDAIDPLVNVVWKKIESWGFAGAGGYWKPELRIRVLPNGEQRARELAILLDGSGLDLNFSKQR